MAQAPLLNLQGVSKRFAAAGKRALAVQALDKVSFAVQPGEVVGLIGPDAGGKTTLLRICAGLVEADSGVVEVRGQPVAQLDRVGIGYMPQDGALYDELTVRQNLELYARLRGIEPAEAPERIALLYRLTGLSAFPDRTVRQLSGGMRQKLALACAVVAAPPLMLLDEPSVGVDPLSRREIWQLARNLAGPESAIVWSTNILEDAALCDKVLLLHNGRVEYHGEPSGLAAVAEGHCRTRALGSASKRDALSKALGDPEVITATIEGENLRVVARPAGTAAPWAAVPARTEDGFARLLDRGEVLPPSALAAAFPLREHGPDAPPVIAAVGLTKRYGSFTAARDISFTVRPGQIFGLLGPNGAGKSTTFRMLCGLARPNEGRGIVAGRNLAGASAATREVLGYMQQRFSLYADLTLAANLRFVAGSYGLRGAAANGAIERVVDALSLEPWLNSATGSLPLGLKQRIALGAAVLHTPPVLFLDEPTSGVDPLVRREFWHHINAIAARGTAVLVTTHFMDEAENCDWLMLINRSETIAQGTAADLRRDAIRGREAATLEEAFIALIEAQRAGDARAA